MSIIKIDNVSFKYQEEAPLVIDRLSLTVEKGEFICVLGKNGSGKSTLAKLLNGMLLPTEGEISVFDMDVKDKNSIFDIRKKVGVVFQNPDNQMVATIVEDDIAFGPENIGLPREEIGKRIDFALDSTAMQNYRQSMGQRLSGGQKQRVAIAGVLAISPDVLILDESTSMLDAKGRKEVMDVVKKLNEEGMTVISITHYMDEAVDSSRVIVLNKGKIVKDGTPLEVFKNSTELENYGLDLPRATYIAEKLKSYGVPLKNGILTAEELEEDLCKLFQKN
jgi:energy-coupling factor transport system ATP-binding protein